MLTTDQRHLLLPQVAPAALAIGSNLYLDLRARGFHGLSKVQIIDPGIAVLKAVPQKSWFDTAIISGIRGDWSHISGHWDSAIGEMYLGQEGERVNGILIRRDAEGGPEDRDHPWQLPGRPARVHVVLEGRPSVRRPLQGQGVLELSKEGEALSGWYTDRDTEGAQARQSWSRRHQMDQ